MRPLCACYTVIPTVACIQYFHVGILCIIYNIFIYIIQAARTNKLRTIHYAHRPKEFVINT